MPKKKIIVWHFTHLCIQEDPRLTLFFFYLERNKRRENRWIKKTQFFTASFAWEKISRVASYANFNFIYIYLNKIHKSVKKKDKSWERETRI